MRRTPTLLSSLTWPNALKNISARQLSGLFMLYGMNIIAGVLLGALWGMYRINPGMAGVTNAVLVAVTAVATGVQWGRHRATEQRILTAVPLLYVLTLGAASLGSEVGYFLGGLALSTLGWGQHRGHRLVSAMPAVLLGILPFVQSDQQTPLTLLTLALPLLAVAPWDRWDRRNILTGPRRVVISLLLTGATGAAVLLSAAGAL